MYALRQYCHMRKVAKAQWSQHRHQIHDIPPDGFQSADEQPASNNQPPPLELQTLPPGRSQNANDPPSQDEITPLPPTQGIDNSNASQDDVQQHHARTEATQADPKKNSGMQPPYGIFIRRITLPNGEVVKEKVVLARGGGELVNPRTWSKTKRYWTLVNISLIGFVVGLASSIDSGVVQQAANEYSVSPIAESTATAIFLVAFGFGGLILGPLSEVFGRVAVYVFTMICFMPLVAASALAQNLSAQISCRFAAGFFAATPLTVAGGSVLDLFDDEERTLAFPIFAIVSFWGPIAGPLIGGFIGQSHLNWDWTEWVTLIASAAVFVSIFFTMPETHVPTLLKWKAKALFKATYDDRYVGDGRITNESLARKIGHAIFGPFVLLWDLILALFAFYITIIYVILFMFFSSYVFIFTDTYGLSQGETGLCFLGIGVGMLLCGLLTFLVRRQYKRKLKAAQHRGIMILPPEYRLYFAFYGAPMIPASLAWMGWTSFPHISFWSPLSAGVLCGVGAVAVFISCYDYVIDCYGEHAASALASLTFLRYTVAGGMTIAAYPMYKTMGIGPATSIAMGLSAAMALFPYVLFYYGHRLRRLSKHAIQPEPESYL